MQEWLRLLRWTIGHHVCHEPVESLGLALHSHHFFMLSTHRILATAVCLCSVSSWECCLRTQSITPTQGVLWSQLWFSGLSWWCFIEDLPSFTTFRAFGLYFPKAHVNSESRLNQGHQLQQLFFLADSSVRLRALSISRSSLSLSKLWTAIRKQLVCVIYTT